MAEDLAGKGHITRTVEAEGRMEPLERTRLQAAKKPGSSARTVYLIRRVQFASYLRLEQVVGRLHLTTAQYMVLSMLGHRQPLSSADLSRRFSVKPQTMFKLISTLKRSGLVSLKGMNSDRRSLQIALTPAGRRVLRTSEAAVDRLEADLFRNFSKAQLAQFRRHLVKYLVDNP